ncbi:MFS transporter [Pontiella agarivorans]|uniref:MFS transporter n=1 Tax=Pontiella agarivorans TaxID=3038953 RepID=A0ABU5N272_9BACT|nr:MFS transporter [Pontiella agarivorans]MDZ8120529.1 MFS transporter [Pontiella agarivorans]
MSEKPEHEKKQGREASIQSEDRVLLHQKVAYGLGVVSDHFANVSIVYLFFLPFFNDFLKVPASIVTGALALARLWDAISDPLVGSISDKWTSKFGRRKPFVITGAILTGLFYPVIWLASPDWNQSVVVAYLVGALLLFFTFYSVFSVPYESLGTELTADYNERTNIFVVRSYMNQFGNIGLSWLFPLATWLALQPWVGGDINGVRLVSILVAVIVISTGVLPGIFCKERYRKIAQEEQKKKKASFKEGFMDLLKNTQLMIVIGIICTYLLAIMSAGALGYYVNVYYIFDGDRFAGTVLGGVEGTLRVVYSLFAAYAIKRMADKFDKHRLMSWCVITMLISLVGLYFSLIPGRPLLALVTRPLWAIGEVGFWILIISMRADVCDWDEYRTGRRREGIISATTNWFTKSAMTLAAVLSGLLIQFAVGLDNKIEDETVLTRIEEKAQEQFEAMSEGERAGQKAEHNVFVRMFKAFPDDGSGRSLEMRVTDAMFYEGDVPEVTVHLLRSQMEQEVIMEQQDEGMLFRMRFFFVLPKFIALAIAYLLLQKYKLSHEKMMEIRAELEERRGKAVAS